MKMSKLGLIAGILSAAVLINGCKKAGDQDNLTVAPVQSDFANITGSTYYVKNDPNSVFKVPVGLTSLRTTPTNINVTVTSSTGAVSGTQYTVPSSTVTIAAGKALDSLAVKGIFAGYPGTRVDTLTFTLSSGDVPASTFNNVYKLVLRKYCDVLLSSFTAAPYAHSNDIQGASVYGPYTATVVSATATGATSATLVIKNLGAGGFGPFAPTDAAANPGLTVNIDWSNPANFTTSIPTQSFYKDPTYGPATIKANGLGTFSSCDNTITIQYTVTVSAGSFGNLTALLKL